MDSINKARISHEYFTLNSLQDMITRLNIAIDINTFFYNTIKEQSEITRLFDHG